jgi:manganese/zinc/iron transport system permease protein
MMISLLDFFSSPLLRASTWGSILIAIAASQVGVIAVIRRRSLIGETVSHATYPGVMLAVMVGSFLGGREGSWWFGIVTMIGASMTGLAGVWSVHFLERRLRLHQDAALTFVLAMFFGVGLTLASRLQFTHTVLYRKAQTILYGQAATLTDGLVWLYLLLLVGIVVIIALLYKEIQAICFDRSFARVVGLLVERLDLFLFGMIVLVIVVGIRTVGVLLMSAMLIGPPIAARQFTHRLGRLFLLSGVIGGISGFLGNYFAVYGSIYLSSEGTSRLSLPTGPMIVLVATAICILSLLFAPERGLLIRFVRRGCFRYRCLQENLLKAVWRMGKGGEASLDNLRFHHSASRPYLILLMWRLTQQGLLARQGSLYRLTDKGWARATHIVRLHRLWEAYLVTCLGTGVERVHNSAEEMEHVLTPELEEELTRLLHNPCNDPHLQPIPPRASR